MKGEFKVGSVVLSNAGHDSGDYFVVVEVVNSDYVLIVNGKTRTLDKPKLKKMKHLKLIGVELSEIASKIQKGELVHDKTIKVALSKLTK